MEIEPGTDCFLVFFLWHDQDGKKQNTFHPEAEWGTTGVQPIIIYINQKHNLIQYRVHQQKNVDCGPFQHNEHDKTPPKKRFVEFGRPTKSPRYGHIMLMIKSPLAWVSWVIGWASLHTTHSDVFWQVAWFFVAQSSTSYQLKVSCRLRRGRGMSSQFKPSDLVPTNQKKVPAWKFQHQCFMPLTILVPSYTFGSAR